MYQSLLTRRYLFSKIMPWLATIAVALCSFLTLTSWSVMGGFLNIFLEIGRKLEGDVSIVWPTVGFGHYEELIQRLEKDPAVEAAAPMIRGFGMISLPDDRAFGVTVQGIDERFAKVSAYGDALFWRPMAKPVPKDALGEDPRLDPEWPMRMERDLRNSPMIDGRPNDPPEPGSFRSWEQMLKDGQTLTVRNPRTGAIEPAAVPGIELAGIAKRRPGGWYSAPAVIGTRRSDGQNRWSSAFMPSRSVVINMLPVDAGGRSLTTTSIRLPVANEFRGGFFEVDKNNVFVPLATMQKLLKMEAGEKVETPSNPFEIDPATGEPPAPKVVGQTTAKVTMVLVKAKPGVKAEELRERCMAVYQQFASDFDGQVPTFQQMVQNDNISTWERNFAMFIGQVRRETVTVLVLLTIISGVCSILILTIFWSMISEKTKDIGILRSVGCSSAGVAWLWLRYGLVIGVSGAGLGLLMACLLVWNINEVHDWLGRAMGIAVWSQETYYLPEIPSKVEFGKAAIVGGSALVFSVLGALIPAVRAARMDPVRALRFE
ncbi:MAG: FtsX-like permease family protein [Phycisphaerales bacterium]|nr:FtsX-like permease family protein [Phycisphaerales bacterium]